MEIICGKIIHFSLSLLCVCVCVFFNIHFYLHSMLHYNVVILHASCFLLCGLYILSYMSHCLSDILHMSLFFIQHYTVSEEFEMFVIFCC